MPVWLQIIIAVIGLCGTTLGILGISSYHNERMKHKAQKRNAAEDKTAEELEELKHQAYIKELKIIVSDTMQPLATDISLVCDEIKEIRRDLSLNTKGTVTILRNDMKKSLDFCRQQGFASVSDRANWMELYNTYKELGGNHFQEYVDAWRQEFEALPTKKKTSKKKLNEGE